MQKIVLDTDFLLTSLKFKVDIFSELKRICDFNYKIYILDKTLDELKGKKEEKLALKLIKKIKILKTKEDKPVDELILRLKNFIVATQDRELKEKLKKGKIPVITIRQKRYLIIENVL